MNGLFVQLLVSIDIKAERQLRRQCHRRITPSLYNVSTDIKAERRLFRRGATEPPGKEDGVGVLGARLLCERWQRHESGYLRISAFLFSARGYAIMCASTGKERLDAQEQRPIALAD